MFQARQGQDESINKSLISAITVWPICSHLCFSRNKQQGTARNKLYSLLHQGNKKKLKKPANIKYQCNFVNYGLTK